MPRLAANLAFLFSDRPFLERFGAAAAAGFAAVELQAHYDHPPSAVRAELDRHRLTILGINTSGGRDGELGLAAVPGREQDFADAVSASARLCGRDPRGVNPLPRRHGCRPNGGLPRKRFSPTTLHGLPISRPRTISSC